MSYLAIDLGAGSGRAIVGRIDGDRLQLEEILRFDNSPVRLGNTIYWDFLSLFANVKRGIALAVKKGHDLNGIGVDTWGVDFGLLDSLGNLLGNPVTYRDSRTGNMSLEAFKAISKSDMFQVSGIQLMEINTLFQLLSLKKANDPSLQVAHKLLFVPDLVNYFLAGKSTNEYTIASTSQLLNAKAKAWDRVLFDKLGLPISIMGNIVFPGAIIGPLMPSIIEETGAGQAKVFAIGSHDTASAIGSIPGDGENWAFLSSGTWSLLGVTANDAILTQNALANDFTNEGGVNGKILFMRNITGLWLLQRLIAEWAEDEGAAQPYDELLSAALTSVPFKSIVNTDDQAFSNPAKMSSAIQDYCQKTDQHMPETKGELVLCVLESLAVKYHDVMDKLKACSGKVIDKLYVVGGGSQNALLNQFTADALNMEVVVGLTEATAIGNIMQQAIANQRIVDWAAAHEIIKNSFTFETFKPTGHEKWQPILTKTKHLFQ
ncbi:MAG: rhamnulokinase [Holophagales bacterium]|jgi:rhamnulokinase|nr:rhamnulokinase [Holophagales bacterium]